MRHLGHAGKVRRGDKAASARRPRAPRGLPRPGGGAGGSAARPLGVALAPPAGGRAVAGSGWGGEVGSPPGGLRSAPVFTLPPNLPPQEPESPEATQFRLAAGGIPEVPFGLGTSPAVLSRYGVATNTVTLFRRVRGSAGVGGTHGAAAAGVAGGHGQLPCRGNTMPCKKAVSAKLRPFWFRS